MGLGGINVWQLLLIVLIFVLAIVAAPIRLRSDSTSQDTSPDPAEHTGENDTREKD